MGMPRTLWPSADSLEIATPHQREVYSQATTGPVGILGGGPGRGKTFLTGQIIKCILKNHGSEHVRIAAPTGKAAQRLNDVMAGHGVKGIEATTIHRMLGVSRNGHDQNGWGFIHDEKNPLSIRFCFIDEGSMLPTSNAASLTDALPHGCHVMFIGDFAQLPPVDHGAPLRDMIAAGLPYGELVEPMRNDGDVVMACQSLAAGRPFTPSPAIDLSADRNLCHLEAAKPAAAIAKLCEVLRNCPPGLRPAWDVQVLCAVNDNTPVSRKVLNKGLQGILNPDGGQVDGMEFRLDDKVICLSNNPTAMVVECSSCLAGPSTIEWDGKIYACQNCGKAWKPADGMVDFVANGEIGKVVLLEKGLVHVEFESPRRTIRVAGEFLKDFSLAYAITTHKSQGSQWPVVIVMADDSKGADMVTSWEHWRTSISRMEKLCFTIGKLSTIHRQCRKSALAPRKTFLKERLMGSSHDR